MVGTTVTITIITGITNLTVTWRSILTNLPFEDV